jgi:hypothetical protein
MSCRDQSICARRKHGISLASGPLESHSAPQSFRSRKQYVVQHRDHPRIPHSAPLQLAPAPPERRLLGPIREEFVTRISLF